jgi:hypothetical protein
VPHDAIRPFSADLNPNHDKWKKGHHFGTDFGKPKHPGKRLQLRAAFKMVDEFDSRGGLLPPSNAGSGSEADEPGRNGGAAPHAQALVPKPVYEEDVPVRRASVLRFGLRFFFCGRSCPSPCTRRMRRCAVVLF